ncbi:MAG: TetR/AcrR family transcriptional regulator [Rectinema sp.]|nr:TetR/AcrR family transcriptional regulator [Rectinema sp.]
MSRERFFEDKTRIIEEAIALIEDEGYESFSTRKLAARLGISPMTLYNYFANKDDLVRETIVFAFNQFLMSMQEDLARYFDSGSCPLKVFKIIAWKLLELSRDHPRIYTLLFVMDLRPFYHDESIKERYEYAFRRVVERLQDPGAVEELHYHVYLFEVLINALVRNIFTQRGMRNGPEFSSLVQIAYDRLLAPYEACFESCQDNQ